MQIQVKRKPKKSAKIIDSKVFEYWKMEGWYTCRGQLHLCESFGVI